MNFVISICLENGSSVAFDNSCSENSIYFQNSVPFQQLIRAWTKLSVSFINRMKKSLNELTPFSVESSSIQQRSSETSSLNQF